MAQPRHQTESEWSSPAGPGRAEIKIRGSRFLADVRPVDGEDDAAAHLERLRGEFPGATHHCWGWRLRRGEEVVERSADAGEPAGSAGAPILRALAGVENASAVVVRWFGGVKLGVGPLARAYRDAATAALTAAGVETRRRLHTLTVSFPHGTSGEVRRALARSGARILAEDHGERAELVIGVTPGRGEAVTAALHEASRGQATVAARGHLIVRASR